MHLPEWCLNYDRFYDFCLNRCDFKKFFILIPVLIFNGDRLFLKTSRREVRITKFIHNYQQFHYNKNFYLRRSINLFILYSIFPPKTSLQPSSTNCYNQRTFSSLQTFLFLFNNFRSNLLQVVSFITWLPFIIIIFYLFLILFLRPLFCSLLLFRERTRTSTCCSLQQYQIPFENICKTIIELNFKIFRYSFRFCFSSKQAVCCFY